MQNRAKSTIVQYTNEVCFDFNDQFLSVLWHGEIRIKNRTYLLFITVLPNCTRPQFTRPLCANSELFKTIYILFCTSFTVYDLYETLRAYTVVLKKTYC
jgi:hypothetical protein